MIKNFQAYELALKLQRKTESIQLKRSLKDQLERASESIILNLAEGSGKPTMAEKKRFYAIAFGSTREVQAIFDIIQLKDRDTLDLVDHVAACLYRLVYK